MRGCVTAKESYKLKVSYLHGRVALLSKCISHRGSRRPVLDNDAVSSAKEGSYVMASRLLWTLNVRSDANRASMGCAVGSISGPCEIESGLRPKQDAYLG